MPDHECRPLTTPGGVTARVHMAPDASPEAIAAIGAIIDAAQRLATQSPDRGACAGRTYTLRGQRVTVIRGWRGKGPRNVLIQYPDGTLAVRPFRGLRRAP